MSRIQMRVTGLNKMLDKLEAGTRADTIISGLNVNACEPILLPSIAAWPISAAAFTAVRCWRMSPGFLRPARMLWMENGFPETRESEREVRRI